MLTLVIQKELVSANVPVRWCLDEDSLYAIRAKQHKPYVCITVKYGGGRKSAIHLFPMDQYSAYIDLHYPGNIKITAAIVMSDANHRFDLVRCFVTASYDRQEPIANTQYDADDLELKSNVECLYTSKPHSIKVADNLFGKELPEWSKYYINKYWYGRNKCVDECDQRRRVLLFPFTTLPILLVDFLCRELYAIAITLLLWSVLCHYKFTRILHPFEHPITKNDVVWFVELFYNKALKPFVEKKIGKNEDGSSYQFATFLASIPIMPVVLGMEMLTMHIDYTSMPLLIGSNYAFSILFVLAVTILYTVMTWINRKFMRLANAIKSTRVMPILDRIADRLMIFADHIMYADFSKANDVKAVDTKTALLLCTDVKGQCLPELRLRDKSARLIFAEIKNAVCKPMRG